MVKDTAQSTAFLTRMQQRADAMGGTIEFIFKPRCIKTVADIVHYAITIPIPATVRNGAKGYRRGQNLGTTRSLLDLYLLCKHYHPEVSIFAVRDVLQELNNKRELYANFCVTFRRMMFHYENFCYPADLPNYGIRKPKNYK